MKMNFAYQDLTLGVQPMNGGTFLKDYLTKE